MGLETLLIVGLGVAAGAMMGGMMGGGDSAPSAPQIPQIPDLSQAEADAESEADAMRRNLLDRDSTVHTSPLGDLTEATTAKKSLLGE